MKTKEQRPCSGVSIVNFELKWWLRRLYCSRRSRSQMSYQIGVLENFAKFTRKHLCPSLFPNTVAGLRTVALLKKRLRHRCFSVNFAKFVRTLFFIEHLRWLLLTALDFSKVSSPDLIQWCFWRSMSLPFISIIQSFRPAFKRTLSSRPLQTTI